MTSYPSITPVDSERLRECFRPHEIDQIMHLAYLSLQCFDLFQLAASTFQISDEEMLEMYYRIGDAMGIERMRWD